MKIRKVDDKPMVIHTKEKAKIHAHEPKGAKIKGSNIYTVERGPKTAGAISTIEDKQELLKLKKILIAARDCCNLVRTFGDDELKETFAKMELTKLSSLISEVQHHIDNINQKELFASDETTKLLVNEAMEDITFNFSKISEEELRIVGGKDAVTEKYKKTVRAFTQNIDPDDPEFITLQEAFLLRFKQHGFEPKSVSEIEEQGKELEDILKKLDELQKKNTVLLRKYNGDAKFARVHKRIKEENLARKAENKQPIVSEYDMSIMNVLLSIKRNNYVVNRIKPDNEQIYYIIDAINDAINAGKQISFQYYDYTGLKKKVLKNKGEVYKLSPYKLLWCGDYYYVLGYSEKKSKVINFRVDRIASKPEILDKDIIPMPDDFDIENYTKEVFFMFSGEKVLVDLRCDNSLMKTMVDRFGEDVTTLAYDMTSFRVQTEVSASPTFFGWVFGFNGKVQILEPESVKEQYRQMIAKADEDMQKSE